jgi:hypothetical protein
MHEKDDCEETSKPHNPLWRRAFRSFRNWQATRKNAHNPVTRIGGIDLQAIAPIITPLPWHAIKRDNGSLIVFCSDLCITNYTITAVEDGEMYHQVRVAPGLECVVCYWCGNLFYKADPKCFNHAPGACKTWQWRQTYQATQTIAALYALFEGEIPDEALEDAEHLAAAYGPNSDGETIAKSVYATWDLF